MADRPTYVWTGSGWDTIADPGAVRNSLVSVAGQVIASTGANTPAVVTAGTTNGHVLTWDNAVATKMKWAAAPASGIPATLLDAKGDLIVASAADTAARLAVGTNGHALLADSGATNGVKWGAVGKVLQVVSTTKTDTFSSTSGTFTDVTGLSASITPTSTSSKILVFVQITGNGTSQATTAMFRLMRDSTAIAVGDAASGRTQATMDIYIPDNNTLGGQGAILLDSPATTSATTYKVQTKRGATSGTVYVNRTPTDTDGAAFSRTVSTITLLEIGA